MRTTVTPRHSHLHSRFLRRGLIACGAAVIALVGALGASAPASARTTPHPTRAHWTVRDLGVLPGGLTSTAVAINDRGDIVGSGDTGPVISPTHAVLWRRGRVIDLGTLGGPNSAATDIDNRGDIVGWSLVNATDMHAFLYRNGRMRDLGTLGGPTSSATAINDRGDIVGYSRIPGAAFVVHAFLYRNGRMTDLGTLNGGFSEALGINDAGVVVGLASVDGMNAVPVRFSHGRAIALSSRYGSAVAVNDRGQVAGTWSGGNGAFLLSRLSVPSRARFSTLTGVAGEGFPQAFGLNDRGQVVGYTTYHGFVWQYGRVSQVSQVTALPQLHGSTSGALGINELGQIVGYGATTASGGNAHAALWTWHTH